MFAGRPFPFALLVSGSFPFSQLVLGAFPFPSPHPPNLLSNFSWAYRYIYISIYLYVFIYLHICTYMSIHLYIDISAYSYIYITTYLSVSLYLYTRICTSNVCVCVCPILRRGVQKSRMPALHWHGIGTRGSTMVSLKEVKRKQYKQIHVWRLRKVMVGHEHMLNPSELFICRFIYAHTAPSNSRIVIMCSEAIPAMGATQRS